MAAGVDQEDVDELVHSVASADGLREQLATHGDVFFCLQTYCFMMFHV